jgi:hypothetical protein
VPGRPKGDASAADDAAGVQASKDHAGALTLPSIRGEGRPQEPLAFVPAPQAGKGQADLVGETSAESMVITPIRYGGGSAIAMLSQHSGVLSNHSRAFWQSLRDGRYLPEFVKSRGVFSHALT